MKKVFLLFLITILVFQCGEIEDYELDNELDPNNPVFTEPQTTIRPIPSSNLTKSSFIVDWEGNISSMEFRHKLDQNPWTDWGIQTSTSLDYLDEGSHTFSVQGRYLSGYQEAIPDSVVFITDAVTGPALRIAPLYKESANGDLFSVDIMAEDLSGVAAVELLVLFDPNVISFFKAEKGEFFTRAQGYVLEISKLKESNQVQINIGTYNGSSKVVSGSGVICRIFFNSLKVGQSTLSLQQSSSTRDSQNNNILINQLVNGIVVIK